MTFVKPSLRFILFFSFLLMSMIPVLLLGWWTINSARDNEYVAVEDKHLLVAKNLTLALSRYAQDTTAVLNYFSKVYLTDKESINKTLLESQNITSFRVFDKSSAQQFAISTDGSAQPNSLTPAQIDAARKASNTTTTIFLPVQADSNGKPRILVVSPIEMGENYLVAEMATDYFGQIQGKVLFGELGHAAIVDQNGNILAHPNPGWVKQIKNIAKVSIVKRMMNRETGVEQFYSPAKKADMIAGFSFVSKTGWGVMVPQPIAELNAKVDKVKQAVLGVGVLGISLATFLSWFLAIKLARPTQQLSAWQRAVLDSAGYCIISTDKNGVIATFNSKAEKMLGYSASEIIGKATPIIIHDPEEIQQYAIELSLELDEEIAPDFEVLVKKARNGTVDEREWNYVHKDGSHVPVYLSVTAMHAGNENIIGFLAVGSDLTEHKAMQANLLESETRYQALFESAGDAICLLDDNSCFIDCNPAVLTLFRCTREQFIGESVLRFSPEFQPDGASSLEKASVKIKNAFDGKNQFFEWVHVTFDGTPFDVEVSISVVKIGNKPVIQSILRNITDRKHFEQQLSYQARHDSLTGLLNRKSLHEAFPRHIEVAKAQDLSVFMMLLDLDRFKIINDTLGHHLGDQVLAEVGRRLKSQCEGDVTIARLGGDEFTILSTTNESIDEIKRKAESFIEALMAPLKTGGIDINIGASIGIACYPQHGVDSHQLLRAADVAMYEAKRRSLGSIVYNPDFDENTTQRLKFASELAKAVVENQLILHYQPKINIATGEISGFEALIRWLHPKEGLLFPDRVY